MKNAHKLQVDGMNYAQKQQALKDVLVRSGTLIGEQRALDIMEVALHRKWGWGFDRINALLDFMRELDEYYAPAFEVSMESDVYQERLDNELMDIIKDRQELIPFDKRYPEVRQLGYTKLPRR